MTQRAGRALTSAGLASVTARPVSVFMFEAGELPSWRFIDARSPQFRLPAINHGGRGACSGLWDQEPLNPSQERNLHVWSTQRLADGEKQPPKIWRGDEYHLLQVSSCGEKNNKKNDDMLRHGRMKCQPMPSFWLLNMLSYQRQNYHEIRKNTRLCNERTWHGEKKIPWKTFPRNTKKEIITHNITQTSRLNDVKQDRCSSANWFNNMMSWVVLQRYYSQRKQNAITQ